MDNKRTPWFSLVCNYSSTSEFQLWFSYSWFNPLRPNKTIWPTLVNVGPICSLMTHGTNLLPGAHFNDVIMGAIASQITVSRLVTQPFIQIQIKENIKAPRNWPLRNSPGNNICWIGFPEIQAGKRWWSTRWLRRQRIERQISWEAGN